MTTTSSSTNGKTITNGAAAAGATMKASEVQATPLVRLEDFAAQRTGYEGGHYHFELHQMLEDGSHSTVGSFRGVDPKALAGNAFNLARDDARQFARRTRYELVALDPSGRREARCAFNMDGSSVDGVREAESATPAAMLLQMMRSNEHLFTQGRDGINDNAKTSQALITCQQAIIDRLTKTLESRDASLSESHEAREKLLKQACELDADREAARRKDARFEKIGGAFVETALPLLKLALARRLGGGAAAPPKELAAAPAPSATATAVVSAEPAPEGVRLTSQECASVLEFVQSLDETTFFAVLKVLPEKAGNQLLALAEVLRKTAASP